MKLFLIFVGDNFESMTHDKKKEITLDAFIDHSPPATGLPHANDQFVQFYTQHDVNSSSIKCPDKPSWNCGMNDSSVNPVVDDTNVDSVHQHNKINVSQSSAELLDDVSETNTPPDNENKPQFFINKAFHNNDITKL